MGEAEKERKQAPIHWFTPQKWRLEQAKAGNREHNPDLPRGWQESKLFEPSLAAS